MSEDSRVNTREWQPIDTCPTEDRVLMAKLHNGRLFWMASGSIGKPDEQGWCDFTDDDFDAYGGDYHQPTHWMTLPEPPK